MSIVFLFTLFGTTTPASGSDDLVLSDPTDPQRPAAPHKRTPSINEKKILVDLSDQNLTAYRRGIEIMRFPISSGRNGNTAVGSFQILDKYQAPQNPTWGYTMPNWMGIYWVGSNIENGIHALPIAQDGRELWGDQIGSPASDGCIVLRPFDMKWLYEWAEVGTPVEIVE